jgi:hypothetical protein
MEKGRYLATFVVVPLSLAEAQRLLPGQLRLGPQNVTCLGTHPLLCTFGSQRDVRTVIPFFDGADVVQVLDYLDWLDKQAVLPPLLPPIDYLEIITALPYVEWVNPKNTCHGPFLFAPRLYLDKPYPTFGGWLLGYAKEMARIEGDEQEFQVNRLADNVLLFRGSCKPIGEPSPPTAFPNFERIRPMLEQPVLGKTKAGPYVRTRFDYLLKKAQMRAAPATVNLMKNFFSPDLGAKSLSTPGIDQDDLGSFCMGARWELTHPVVCRPG